MVIRQIEKDCRIFSFLAVMSAFNAIALLTFVDMSLASPPPTYWSVRGTGLNSLRSCSRRALQAMDQEDLENIRTSGNFGFRGESNSTRAYILCRERGTLAYMFCAGDRAGRICRNLARYMQD